MSKPFIKRFQIKRLFKNLYVDIPFDNNFNIFVGENGLGKTTILNCLTYVLQCDSASLSNIDFDVITLTFHDDKEITIKHSNLQPDYTTKNWPSQYIAFHGIDGSDIKQKYWEIKTNDNSATMQTISEQIINDLNVRSQLQLNRIKRYIEFVDSSPTTKWEKVIHEHMNNPIIYLPTYRRVEENLSTLVDDESIYETRQFSKLLTRVNNLHFGMDDVAQLISEACDKLRASTNEGFKEMMSSLLASYIKMVKGTKSRTKYHLLNSATATSRLDIILKRLADNIDEKTRSAIIDLIDNEAESKEPNDFKYEYLRVIINNLLSLDSKTKAMDEDLELFANTCNGYLNNKKFSYDPFKIECALISNFGGKPLTFQALSSGEKQIISLFSKLFLAGEKENIILFDEPELSLSILWQEKLIPDIEKSQKCNFLFAVTHSPFIFNNEYKQYTRDIQNHISYMA